MRQRRMSPSPSPLFPPGRLPKVSEIVSFIVVDIPLVACPSIFPFVQITSTALRFILVLPVSVLCALRGSNPSRVVAVAKESLRWTFPLLRPLQNVTRRVGPTPDIPRRFRLVATSGSTSPQLHKAPGPRRPPVHLLNYWLTRLLSSTLELSVTLPAIRRLNSTVRLRIYPLIPPLSTFGGGIMAPYSATIPLDRAWLSHIWTAQEIALLPPLCSAIRVMRTISSFHQETTWWILPMIRGLRLIGLFRAKHLVSALMPISYPCDDTTAQ